MSDEDMRFEYPLELVRQNILGCLEASKDCCTIPGTRHLYHITFVARSPEQIARLNPNDPLDFFLEAKYAHCPEVSWYLHLQEEAGKRQELPTQEPLPEDEAEVEATPKEILKMWCDHGLVPTTDCVSCYNEDPRNWDPPPYANVKPLTEEQIANVKTRVINWAEATKALYNLKPVCPTPGRTAGSAETGRICSKLPHTSSGPSEALSRDFSQTSTTDTNRLTLAGTLCEDHCINKKPHYGTCTIGVASRPTLEQLQYENRRENSRLADGPLKELSWMGTLGYPPADYKNKEQS